MSKKPKNNILLLLALFTSLLLLSYQITHALFSDTAVSSNNAFTASSEFPTPETTETTPTLTPTPTFTPTPTLTPTATPTPTGEPAGQEVVVINEFVVNPGSIFTKEWVELFNPGSNSVDLTGWALKDAANPSKSISSLGVISVGSFKVYEESEGWLNNGGDTIYLIKPGDQVVDSHTYSGNINDDKSIGRTTDNGSIWSICNIPTKNSSNDGFCL